MKTQSLTKGDKLTHHGKESLILSLSKDGPSKDEM